MNIIPDIDTDKIVDGVTFFTINTKISSGKMHGQSKNTKPLGFVSVKADGYTGISEIYGATYISVGFSSIFEYLNYLIQGKSLKQTLNILNNLSIPFVSRNGIFQASLGCLENAVFDLCAKIKGIPLYKLFESNNQFPKIYASGGSVICSSEDIKYESDKVINDGYQGYKIRVGLQSWDDDKKRISSINKDLKYKMVDGICGTRVPCWTYEEASSKLSFLEIEDIYWLEEPLNPDDFQNHFHLQSDTAMHIAAGEAYSGYGELKNLIDIGQIDIIQFDSCHSGGLSVCKNISDYATEKGKKTAIHVWGSAVAINTNFHLALILGNLDFLEKPLIELEIDSMIGKKYTTIDELKESILEKPGIGIEIQDFENISIDNSFGFEYKW